MTKKKAKKPNSKSKALAKKSPEFEQALAAILPVKADDNSIEILKHLVEYCRTTFDFQHDVNSAFNRAKCLKAIQDAITQPMLEDLRLLMNDPNGFKTDRPSAKHPEVYDDHSLRTCIASALLDGAALSGNEFNILDGSPYLTKEFFKRHIDNHAGATDFNGEVGVPKINATSRLALCTASATWKQDGEVRTLVFKDESGMGVGLDRRLVINFETRDSVTKIQGKARRQLFLRVWESISGEKYLDTNTVDAVVAPLNIENEVGQ